ncbi:NAD(P)-binding domain-containing protein [Pseudoruegeria sp. SK021]|uniref:NAD(P)-binding domain-containing protein n=1 Tax=Pseudoruegeria sp. SK021 TaxID=1933035 RepID=UPI000A2248B6|nr:NAD(P)/FAD-dependent oxidoreductase [Pseudoruegeria sp. SK021]OSP54198.1 FAD-dependent oxidoreductase [Pseudoruegeria sp. SK021]
MPEAAQHTPPQTFSDTGLAGLEARLRYDLACLCYPGNDWVPTHSVSGEQVTDVVIVGGGMCGLVAWLSLRMAGLRNIRIIDRNPAGFEGPWLTYARMETLRSPKTLTGPAFGLGALTFQAWYRAQHGDAAWAALDKIPRPMWMEYLRWYRQVLDVPIENGTALEQVTPEGDYLRLRWSGPTGESVLARKIVYATGREGTGHPTIPAFVANTPRIRWAHSSDAIDFAALKGKRVAVVGVGASAIDNAAEALEAGAAEVRHLIRRSEMPTINKMMGIGSFGFNAGFQGLSDAERWRFMHYSFATQTPAPRGSTLRVSRHDNAFFHFGKAVSAVTDTGTELHIQFADGTALETDFLILGTGFSVDPMARTEFGAAAGDILLWRDVYTPPAGDEDPDLGRFPYLNRDFTFRERVVGTAPWLANVYCFNYASTASLGKISGDIPGVSEGAAWMARALSERLYAEDANTHWQRLQSYATPELLGDEWTASPLPPMTKTGQVA